MKKCPLCKSRSLNEVIGFSTLYRQEIPYHFSVCNNCGSELCDHKQVKKNKKIDMKAKIDHDEEVAKIVDKISRSISFDEDSILKRSKEPISKERREFINKICGDAMSKALGDLDL